MTRLVRKVLRSVFQYDPAFCDMYADADSRRAGAEYLEPIRRTLRERFPARPVTILDAGCQAGRLLIPLALDGHRLIGVDTSGFALRRARRHARQQGVSVQLHRGRLAQLQRWVVPASVEAVLCMEVLYLCRDYRTILARLAEAVTPGGLLFVSHRPMLYYLVKALSRGRADQAADILSRGDGPSPEGAYHNWQTPEQVAALYREQGLELFDSLPVNRLTVSCDPATVQDDRAARLLDPWRVGETTFRVPMHVLAVGQRPARVGAVAEPPPALAGHGAAG